jgi:DNA repair protein RecO (recombination protein O)
MIVSTRGIVLRTVKYSETSLICDILTEKIGLQTYIISGVRKKKAKIGASLLQVMSILDIVAFHKNNRDINRTTEIKSAYVYQEMPYDVVKGAVGLFIAELIQKTIKEQEENQPLFEFLYHAFTLLDTNQNSVANYHIGFMVQLTQYLGFMIDDNYEAEKRGFFDVRAGKFQKDRIANLDGLNEGLSQALFAFCQLPLEETHLVQLNREDRRTLLNRMIRFYQYRIDNFNELNAFKVLQEIF